MSRPPANWLAYGFIALGIGAALSIGLMVSGRLQVQGEWPGLVAGVILAAVILLALRRRQ